MIGGNKVATVQIKTTTKNAIGESESTWTDEALVKGYLNFQSGQNSYYSWDAKIQETTHIFLCDYDELAGHNVTPENSRFLCEGCIYDILLIDNVQEMRKHCEIYLKYIGAGIGV